MSEWSLHNEPHREAIRNSHGAKVDSSGGLEACWPWTASCHMRGGYGQLRDGAKTLKAHRVALELSLGRRLKPEEHALHSCDNPICCNPAHLRVGSNTDNVRDAVARGRYKVGRNSKLTAADVRRIRKGEPSSALATELGVHPSTIRRIRRGERWARA